MSKDYEDLKAEIASWYPGETFTNDELNGMADRLIEFFAVGAQLVSSPETSSETT